LIARRAGVRYSRTGITITGPTARICLFFECLFTVMKIMLNGQKKSFKAPLTVSALLQDMGLGERRVAVEVNREIVPRSRHDEFQLKDNDRVEVVFAIGGGGMSCGEVVYGGNC
jgi:sulfur carrier protein